MRPGVRDLGSRFDDRCRACGRGIRRLSRYLFMVMAKRLMSVYGTVADARDRAADERERTPDATDIDSGARDERSTARDRRADAREQAAGLTETGGPAGRAAASR